jgi:hypothetical protein
MSEGRGVPLYKLTGAPAGKVPAALRAQAEEFASTANRPRVVRRFPEMSKTREWHVWQPIEALPEADLVRSVAYPEAADAISSNATKRVGKAVRMRPGWPAELRSTVQRLEQKRRKLREVEITKSIAMSNLPLHRVSDSLLRLPQLDDEEGLAPVDDELATDLGGFSANDVDMPFDHEDDDPFSTGQSLAAERLQSVESLPSLLSHASSLPTVADESMTSFEQPQDVLQQRARRVFGTSLPPWHSQPHQSLTDPERVLLPPPSHASFRTRSHASERSIEIGSVSRGRSLSSGLLAEQADAYLYTGPRHAVQRLYLQACIMTGLVPHRTVCQRLELHQPFTISGLALDDASVVPLAVALADGELPFEVVDLQNALCSDWALAAVLDALAQNPQVKV